MPLEHLHSQAQVAQCLAALLAVAPLVVEAVVEVANLPWKWLR